MDDSSLARLIDECCEKRTLKIPSTEVRLPRIRPSVPHLAQGQTELCALGVRVVEEEAPVRLAFLILQAYESASAMDDLVWRLRSLAQESVLQDLHAFLRREGPAATVRKLVLTSKPATSFFTSTLAINEAPRPEGTFERLILWKCGYDVPIFRTALQTLRERLREFHEVATTVADTSEEADRAKIRSAGVNLFVSLEEVLQEIVAFNTWMLASDHFAGTMLEYAPAAAVQSVESTLGGLYPATQDQPGALPPRWSSSGRNSLGTSLVYLDLLVKWAGGLAGAERGLLVRPEASCPGTEQRGSRRFAFRHLALWADCSTVSLQRHTERLGDLLRLLARADVAGVRNGIDHMREAEEFPTLDKLLAFSSLLQSAVERIEQGRLYPREFWLQQSTHSRDGLATYELADYRGVRAELIGPPMVYGLDWESRLIEESPIILGPEDFLGLPGTTLCFGLRHASPYSEYWADYPRVRDVEEHVTPGPGVAVDESSDAASALEE